jgi:hypothetical protein
MVRRTAEGTDEMFTSNNEVKVVRLNGNKCVRAVSLGGYFFGSFDFHLCGYVALRTDSIPEEWRNREYEDYPIEVHGGITFLETKGEFTVFGFDCAHYGDENSQAMHDPDKVMEMVEDMERQQIGLFTPKQLPE